MTINFIRAMVRNNRVRPIIKAVSWRIFAMIITGVVVYVYTGEIKKSGEISVVAGIILTLVYYLHERFWMWARK